MIQLLTVNLARARFATIWASQECGSGKQTEPKLRESPGWSSTAVAGLMIINLVMTRAESCADLHLPRETMSFYETAAATKQACPSASRPL
jgi:hypothetical protein